MKTRICADKKRGSLARGVIFGFALALFFSGCGYSTRAVNVTPYRTIHVEPFVNKVDVISENVTSPTQRFRTYHPLMEVDMRTAIINRFMYDGGMRLADKGKADVILKGDVIDYQRQDLRYENNQEDVLEYRVNLVMHLTLIRRADNKVLWEEPSFVGQATYFTTGTQAKTEQQAVDEAISDLAKRVVERTIEDW